jgi:predicted transcriptional regulator
MADTFDVEARALEIANELGSWVLDGGFDTREAAKLIAAALRDASAPAAALVEEGDAMARRLKYWGPAVRWRALRTPKGDE